MRYHIYHSQSSNINRSDWDVTDDFVKSIVNGYLRGKNEVVLNGEKYSIGSEVFMIYENPSKQDVSGLLEDSLIKLNGAQAQFDKDFFNKNFKNVTQQFLFGREWGELKDDYYNIYINDGQKQTVILVLNKEEVEDFLNKWSNGENPIWVSGRRVDLNDPKSIKIYSINFEWLSKDRGDIKFNIKKYTNLIHRGSFKIDTLEHFGKDVTDKWNVNPYGKSKAKSSSFDWAIIHPEIDRVANSRFNSGHYADAVEAAFKELNDLIKKEFTKHLAQEEDGVNLMRQAFKPSNPIFKLNQLKSETDRNIQDGYMQIFAGSMAAIRNPKAHANLEIDQLDSWEKIVLASHLMKMWYGREK